jgi:phosphoglycolate phosphatase-like HAD superfamily hydrolase
VQYYTQLLEVGDLLEGTTSKHDAEFSKPSPEIFQAALDRMGTDDAFTFPVGDTPSDILASHRCALPVVAVLSGGFQRQLLTKELGRKIDRIDAYCND